MNLRVQGSRHLATHAAGTIIAIAASVGAGVVFALTVAPSLSSRYFPWLTGRALGIAAYLMLFALVALGIWMRHPWRFRLLSLHGETMLRAHRALGVSALACIVGHLISLASDKYAGVGWAGALIPGMSHFRRGPVALGTAAMFATVLIAVTASQAGRKGSHHWLAVHRTGAACFLAVWFHGVLSGTDTDTLRPVYLVTGLVVALLMITRSFAGHAARPTSAFVTDDDERRVNDIARGFAPHEH
jgi:DMSO/TMAO reductase YedYZ heme-binding membrane subunit